MDNYKFYRKDNYIVLSNDTTKETFYGFVKEVLVDKSNLNKPHYRFFNIKDWNSDTPLLITQLLKEDGSPYSQINFEEFYRQNTGNFNGGGSAPGVQSVTGVGVDNSDPQNPVINIPDISNKEDKSNKSQDIESDRFSTENYPSTKETYDWTTSYFERNYGITPINTYIPYIDNLTDLAIVSPNTTYSFANNVLSVSKTNGNFQDDEFIYTKYGSSSLENFELEVIGICRTVGLGLAPFLKSPQELYKFNWSCRKTSTGLAISSTTANGTTWSDRITSTVGFTVNVNDSVSYKLNRVKNKITYTIQNLSTLETISLSFTSSYNEVNNCQPTMFQYGFQVLGGTWDVTSFTAKSPLLKNVDNLFLGDSITQGFSMADPSVIQLSSSTRYFDLLDNMTRARLKNINLSAGGATLNDSVGLVSEIQLINPKNVFVLLGTNGQNQAMYNSLIVALTQLGYNVIPQTIPPTYGSFNSWIKTTYLKTLDTSAPLFTSGNSSGTTWNTTYEGFSGHPNIAGHNEMYKILLNYVNSLILPAPIIYATSIDDTSINLSWNQVTYNNGYKLQYSSDGLTFSDLVLTSLNMNSYNHTGLTTDKGYYYRVLTIGDAAHANSEYSMISSYKTEVCTILGDFMQSVTVPQAIPTNKKLLSGVDGWFKFNVSNYSINQVDRVILGLRHNNALNGDNSEYHNYMFYYVPDSKIHLSSLVTDIALPIINYQVNQWIRLRRNSGVVYYEYSNDNISWIILGSRPDTSDLYAQVMFLVAGTKVRSVTVSNGFINA